ncbi:MAG: DUF167 family protein [Candidatus Vogelbacteria bacterium]|nr:DUF167 family protein [Candidatus Vogelbacteria bacterium]
MKLSNTLFVKVKVIPGSHRQKLAILQPDSLVLSVKEPAENNLANLRVVVMVAEYYQVLPKQVKIISGHHRPNKMLEVKV